MLAVLLLIQQETASWARRQPFKVGEPLPGWSEGCLDIHAINSARGECTFLILPDGTSLCVDAGEMYRYTGKLTPVAPKPDGATRPYKVYADYIRHFLPARSADSLDYFLLSHYHMDHMGREEKGFSKDPDGGYVLSGVTALYGEIPFRMLLDRSWPDYSEAIRTGGTSRGMDFYTQFVSYCSAHRGLMVQRFEVGSDTQIVLRHRPGAYPLFRVMNYAGSGLAWDGSAVVDTQAARENAMSCAFLLSYGRFDYWTSGDNNYDKLVSITSSAIGRPIEAMKCHHHMSNPKPFFIENEVLRPQVVVTESFYVRDIQPHQEIIAAAGDAQDLFFTNLDPALAASRPEIYGKCKSSGGHYVIRVLPGGRRFYVIRLDDTSPDYPVREVFGPYKCH